MADWTHARTPEKALLVQPHAPGRQDPALLEEFAELARSAGAEVVGEVMARVERPSAPSETAPMRTCRSIRSASGPERRER